MIEGVSAFPITPASGRGVVNASALRALVARLVEAGVDSIGLLGSTGSYPYLERAERRRAVDAARSVAGSVPLLVGVGALRTDEAVHLAQDARGAGAAVGLLAPVSYTPLTEDEVFEHFATVGRESGLPLCIYDNPTTTGFTFTPALIGRLSRLPGIVALKSPAPAPDRVAAHLRALRAAASPGLSIGCSVDVHAAEALLAGAKAWYSVAAGLFPRPCVQLARAVGDGRAEDARALDARLRPLWDLFPAHSSLRVMYAAAAILGLCDEAPPRPILPLSAEVRGRVAAVIEELGLR